MALPNHFRIKTDANTYTWNEEKEVWEDKSKIYQTGRMANLITMAFLAKEAQRIIEATTDKSEQRFFLKTLYRMNLSFDKLAELFGQEAVGEALPGIRDRVQTTSNSSLIDNEITNQNTFLNHTELRNEYFAAAAKMHFPYEIEVIGHGPFEKSEFESFVDTRVYEIEPNYNETQVAVVVIGREGWDELSINEIIESADTRYLRIYSQEMFLSVLAGQPDPFDFIENERRSRLLEIFRYGHPGLEYVSQGWSGWVNTEIVSTRSVQSTTKENTYDRAAQSPLHVMGYSVGKKGISQRRRRLILQDAYKGSIPLVESREYMEEWGEPNSGKRLRRIAQQLASNVQMFGRRENAHSYQQAIDDWCDDLEWIKVNYYSGTYRFDWPSGKRFPQ